MTPRLRLLIVGILTIWSALAIRLFYLQAFRHQTFAQHASSQRALDEVIPARWGDIVDRHGRLLVTTARTPGVFVDPSRIRDPQRLAAPLAEALSLDVDRLTEQIATHQHRKFLWVKRRISETELDRLLHLELPRGTWGLREEFQRIYPHGTLAAQVLGWRNIDGLPQAGIEHTQNDVLMGVPGERQLIRDARGYVIEVLEAVTRAPQHGRTVTLTLDALIQRIAEDRLEALVTEWRPSNASVIAMVPRTGEILAMASRPTFDPASPAGAPKAWTNQAISAAFEPGSTIKPCIAAWAVDHRFVDPNEVFPCNGTYRMGHRLLHDHRPYGDLDVAGIIAKSSNIGMAQIGSRLGNENLFRAVSEFGFGRVTGIELPAESAGILRPLERWDHFSTGSIPMGQELAATPLQVITAISTLANQGVRVSPRIVLQRQAASPQPADVLALQVLDSQTATWMVSGPMTDVVKYGTARQTAIPGLDVFAKTGTAQKFDPATGAYAENRYVTSCVCGAPARSPELLVLVTVDEPQSQQEPFGGTVAAPAAADILRAALPFVQPSRTPAPFEQMATMPNLPAAEPQAR